MQKANYENELLKRQFFNYLRNSQRFSEDSIMAFENALIRWEEFTGNSDLSVFNEKLAIDFREWLKTKKRKGSENLLTLGYCYDTFRRLRKFFEWLALQPKSKINPTHLSILNLSRKENQIATRERRRDSPTMQEVLKVLEGIEGRTEIEKRDRALIAFTLLTGARISAIVSLRMKSFDRRRLVVEQEPASGVKTKFSKQIVTVLFPLPDKKPLSCFLDWYDYLKQSRNFSDDQPIFPATRLGKGKGGLSFYSTGMVSTDFWGSANLARKIFEKRFKAVGIPYFHPHTFRHLIVKEFMKTRLTEEEKKAISQNLGHEDVRTTFGSYGYGKLPTDRQVEIVRSIKLNHPETEQIFQGMSVKAMKELAKFLKKEMTELEK